ncbi:MAG: serine/threonine-protein kinase [Planctomycetota bacterium]
MSSADPTGGNAEDNARVKRPPTEDIERAAGRTIAGKYVIRAPLGSGAMGTVYLCEHALLPGSRFAVKLLRADLCREPDQRERFLREGRVLLGLQHPSLVGVRDLGETEDGQIYLCLDFCEGLSLTELLERRGALAPEDALDLTQQLLAGLEVAHRAGIVHRDLKPDHLIVGVDEAPDPGAAVGAPAATDAADDPDAERLTVRILDFGIAAVEEPGDDNDLTREILIGTPRYMSPEQAWGNPIDARSDVYAVGLLLHEMLTGTAAVQGQSTKELLTRQRIAQVSRLRDHMRPHPWQRSLERLLRRVLTRDPNRRLSSARAFRDQLELIRSGVPVRRQGRRWGAALAGIAALCMFVSGGTWLWLRDNPEANATPQRRVEDSWSPSKPPKSQLDERPRRSALPYACPLCGFEGDERRICPIDGVRLRARGH